MIVLYWDLASYQNFLKAHLSQSIKLIKMINKNQKQLTFKQLRQAFPIFIYENYSWTIKGNDLKISFDFQILPHIKFKPSVIIQNLNLTKNNRDKNLNEEVINNLVFHLGLIEMLSYWKSTCSPEILIKCGWLNHTEARWWINLYQNGLGQFFYENRIGFTRFKNSEKRGKRQKLLKFTFDQCNNYQKRVAPKIPFKHQAFLIPIGGGKDSLVTLELLKQRKEKITMFALNPSTVVQKIFDLNKNIDAIVAIRKIDPKLLELNQKGFLNGHTPISAYLAFLSVLVSYLSQHQFIAFSNERSANEGNLKYQGRIINHQYSKSFDFETKFRNYSQKYLINNIEYFSFLRPLYEIQIARLFSRFPQYFNIFLSCNVASQTNSGTKKPTFRWCCHCPKCLFVFTCLYPFIDEDQLFNIFGKNLFQDQSNLPLMKELLGEKKFKPFECVGTKEESLAAFYLSWKKAKSINQSSLPSLLQYFEKKILPKYSNLETRAKRVLESYSQQNYLPRELNSYLKHVYENFEY